MRVHRLRVGRGQSGMGVHVRVVVGVLARQALVVTKGWLLLLMMLVCLLVVVR